MNSLVVKVKNVFFFNLGAGLKGSRLLRDAEEDLKNVLASKTDYTICFILWLIY